MAFMAFHAFALFIACIWESADASRGWFDIFAFRWDMDFSLDHPRQWGGAIGNAIVFGGQIIIDVDFAIGRAQHIVSIRVLGD